MSHASALVLLRVRLRVRVRYVSFAQGAPPVPPKGGAATLAQVPPALADPCMPPPPARRLLLPPLLPACRAWVALMAVGVSVLGLWGGELVWGAALGLLWGVVLAAWYQLNRKRKAERRQLVSSRAGVVAEGGGRGWWQRVVSRQACKQASKETE